MVDSREFYSLFSINRFFEEHNLWKILGFSRQFKSSILAVKRKLPFSIYQEIKSYYYHYDISLDELNDFDELYKEYLYQYEMYLYVRKI